MTRRGLLLFAAMSVIWGIPYLLIRVAVGEISPGTLVFVRTGVAALVLMPVVFARGGLRGIGNRLQDLCLRPAAGPRSRPPGGTPNPKPGRPYDSGAPRRPGQGAPAAWWLRR